MPSSSTLIIPGLTAAPAAVATECCPNLRQLCARSRRLDDPGARSQHALIWAALGGAGPAPGAAVASWYAFHGGPPDDPLLMVTPVQMLAGPDQASMVPAADVGPEHQPGLWIRLSQATLEYGARLIAGPEGLIWLKLEEDPGEGGADPFLAAGQPVSLPTETALLKLLNHMQMVLHAEANTGFNSLWFWGGGALPDSMPGTPEVTVVAGDAVARGMALACGARVEDRWPEQGPVIGVDDRLQGIEDPETWQQALAALDRDWFAPLVATNATVEIIDSDAGLRLVASGSWWRRLLTRGGLPSELLRWPQGLPQG
jgi:hypothetical protein